MKSLPNRIVVIISIYFVILAEQFYKNYQQLQETDLYYASFISLGLIFLAIALWNWYLTKRVKDKSDELYRQANYDTLTGLPNGRMMRRELKAMLDRGDPFSVIFFDLDFFKVYNDTYGHGFGDKILVEIGRRLTNSIRPCDQVFRVSGDEFVILLDKAVDRLMVEGIIDRILVLANRGMLVEGIELHPSFSAGISRFPIDAQDTQGLLKKADLAMYKSKDSGKNTYSLFNSKMQDEMDLVSDIQTSFDEALRHGDIKFVFQPQYSMKDRKLAGVEVLSRWKHHTRGEIAPSVFIPIIEKTGSIINLTDRLVEETIKMIRKYSISVPVSINVSSFHLKRRDSDIAQMIEDRCSYYGVNPSMLTVEITEGVLASKTEIVHDRIRRLAQLGGTIAVDDFGTGYSSLAYLKQFPIDIIKIDKSFVDMVNENDIVLVRTIIRMGIELGKDLVAEGIETEAQFECLKMMGCDYAQGFYFSKPLPLDQLLELV